jgi:hypothetical protein
VPDAPVLSLGAPAGALTVTSFEVVDFPRSAIDSFAVASPLAELSMATADACSGSDTVAAVVVTSAVTRVLVAPDAISSRVDAPAI